MQKVYTYGIMVYHINDLCWLSKNVSIDMFQNLLVFFPAVACPPIALPFQRSLHLQTRQICCLVLLPRDRLSFYREGQSSSLSLANAGEPHLVTGYSLNSCSTHLFRPSIEVWLYSKCSIMYPQDQTVFFEILLFLCGYFPKHTFKLPI